MDTHRREWKGLRRVGWLLLQKAMAKDADDAFRLTVIRILTPTFKILPGGETRLHGRDAGLYGWTNLSRDQIDTLAAGKPLR